MNDLVRLNKHIARYWLGRLDASVESYLTRMSVCLGQLTHSTEALVTLLNQLKARSANSLRIGKLNRRYLRFARRAAQDANAGRLDMLLRMGLSVEQATFLRDLNDEDLDRLAFGWGGPIIEVAIEAIRRGAALQAQASALHACAALTTR